MRPSIVVQPEQVQARNRDQEAAGGTTQSSSDRHAAPIAATGPGRRE
jgi:hypothetical protein